MTGLLQPWRFHLLGYPAGFAAPAALLLVLAGLLLGGWALAAALRRRGRVLRLLPERVADRLAPGISTARPVSRAVLSGLGLALLGVAVAQPQCGSHTEVTQRKGIDLVVALDVSNSMLADDVQPNRLERAKLELLTLLDELKGDRVGIVLFAGDAFVQCPLTSDYAAARLFLREARPEQMQQGGTQLSAALETSRRVLDGADRGAKDRVVVLLSDGEDLGDGLGDLPNELREANIRVYTVGIGSEEGTPLPLLDKAGRRVGFRKAPDGSTVISRLDRAGLTRLAEQTGGEFFYEPRGVATRAVVERVDRLQKSELESRVTVRYDERFQYYGGPGLLLLALSAFLSPSSRRRST
ncbi:MAG: BatB protein [Pseudomonadota bacterium]|jgi:Ca-activated chloride channel family protein